MKINKKRFDIIISLLILIAALYFFVSEELVVKIPSALERNVPEIAKSYIYIRFITLSIIFLSGSILITKVVTFQKNKSTDTVSIFNKEVSVTIIALTCYLLFMKYIGFYAASFALIVILLSVYRLKEKGHKPGKDMMTVKTIAFSVLFATILLIVLHILFTIILKVVIPEGII